MLDSYLRGDERSTDIIWSQVGSGGRNQARILTRGSFGESGLKCLSLDVLTYKIIIGIIVPSPFKILCGGR